MFDCIRCESLGWNRARAALASRRIRCAHRTSAVLGREWNLGATHGILEHGFRRPQPSNSITASSSGSTRPGRWTQAQALLGLSWDEVHHIVRRAVARGLSRRELDDLRYLGIDEKNFGAGERAAGAASGRGPRQVSHPCSSAKSSISTHNNPGRRKKVGRDNPLSVDLLP